MAEKEQDPLKLLSLPAQKLAISMCHFGETGGSLEAIKATSGLDDDLNIAIIELEKSNILQKGVLENIGSTTISDFLAENPKGDISKFKPRQIFEFHLDTQNGNRYRLDASAKSSIMAAIFPNRT